MQRTISRWLIDHDTEATRRCYDQIPVGSGCSCNQCRNFNAAAGRTFASEFLALLDTLGVDPTKPAELCHWCREPSGLHLTRGWFHFVGSILVGEDAMHWEHNIGTFHFEEYVAGVEFGFTDQLALVHDRFANFPVVQLEFQTRVPWVLAEPAPEV